MTVVNTATTLDDDKLDIIVNVKKVGEVFNKEGKDNYLPILLRSGWFSNVMTSQEYLILALGKKNGKTVAAERKVWASTMQYVHDVWIITDEMLRPFSFSRVGF